MCGRIVSSTPVSALAEQFVVAEVRAAEAAARYNVAPTDDVVAVATTAAGRRLGTLSWGLVPRWADGPGPGRRLVNLRSERLAERPGFRRTLQSRRCVVPADGFYEWRAAGDGRPRQPHLVRARDGRPLALAGLWDVWRDPAGPYGAALRTCTILTTAPNEVVAALHDRMPVVLPPPACDVWLDPSVTDVDELVALCRPCPPELLEAWPVSTAVNRVANDGPHLVAPMPG
ncbi:MAG TPA: SOS response-associated peptidase [Acidimicrobiales bacterium]|nr:SOS response-associated peptidase [Acidimicrobiales bacterium]